MKDFFEPDDEYDSDDMRNVPQYAIERYAVQVEEILAIFEIPEVFVSDQTQILDFNFNQQESERCNHRLKEKYGVEMTEDSFVWEIAEEIYESQF
jgi:hypothetical protein